MVESSHNDQLYMNIHDLVNIHELVYNEFMVRPPQNDRVEDDGELLDVLELSDLEQIKTLVDICSNFLDSKEWEASDEVATILLESALMPLLEQAFRNGSWLDMAKAADVYASYLGK